MADDGVGAAELDADDVACNGAGRRDVVPVAGAAATAGSLGVAIFIFPRLTARNAP